MLPAARSALGSEQGKHRALRVQALQNPLARRHLVRACQKFSAVLRDARGGSGECFGACVCRPPTVAKTTDSVHMAAGHRLLDMLDMLEKGL